MLLFVILNDTVCSWMVWWSTLNNFARGSGDEVLRWACLCVCLSARNHTRDLYQFFCACCHGRGSVLLWQGDEIPKGKGQFWGNVAAHCKVMGHSVVSCAQWLNRSTCCFGGRLGWAQGLDRGADPPTGKGKFAELSASFKSPRRRVRCRRDHSISSNVMQQKDITRTATYSYGSKFSFLQRTFTIQLMVVPPAKWQ